MSIASQSLSNPLLADLQGFIESVDPVVANQEDQQLFFSIARDESDESIISKIRNIFKSKPDLIHAPSGYYQTSPLTLAVMKDRFEVVRALLKAKADPNEQDEFGWTPMIHSALVSQKVSNILLNNRGKPARISHNGVSFESLCELTAKETDLRSIVRLELFNAENQRIPTTKANIESVLGLTQYRSKSLYHPQHLSYLWSQSSADDLVNIGYHRLIKAGCQMGFPLLAIKNDERLNELGVVKAKGLFSGQALVKGQFIGTYVGESADKENQDFLDVIFGIKTTSPYFFEPIDAMRIGNETRMINDGFPNTCPVNFGHEIYFLTLRDIKAGEELLFNYGAGDVSLKWGHYFIKNKAEIYRLFKLRYDEIFQEDENFNRYRESPAHTTNEFILNRLKMSAAVSYAFFTPQVLIDLVINRVVTVEQIKNLKRLEYISAVSQTDNVIFSWINELIDYLAKFEAVIAKLAEHKLLGSVQTALRSKEGHCTVFQILHFMQKIEHFVEENQPEDYEALLERFLETNLSVVDLYQFRAFDKSMPLFRNIDLDVGDMRDEGVFVHNWQRLNQLLLDQYGTLRVLKDDELESAIIDEVLQEIFGSEEKKEA